MERYLRLAAALVVGGLVAGLVFAVASSGTEPESLEETYGEAHTFEIAEGEPVNESLTFSGTLSLPASPHELDVRVYVFVEVTSPDPHAEGTDLDIATYVNGQQADVVRFRGETAGVAMLQPEQLEDEDALRAGDNEIEMHVDVHRSPDAKGANDVTVGPLTVEATPLGDPSGAGSASSGGLEGVPAVALAPAAGILAAAGTWWATRRWQLGEEEAP